VQSGKTASGGCSAGQGSSELYYYYYYYLVEEEENSLYKELILWM
jgi:hypothetical protein